MVASPGISLVSLRSGTGFAVPQLRRSGNRSALAGGAGRSTAGGLPPGEQILLALARRAGAQGARIAGRRRLALGLGLLDQLAGDADAALDLTRVPVEERLDGVGDRPERQAGGL